MVVNVVCEGDHIRISTVRKIQHHPDEPFQISQGPGLIDPTRGFGIPSLGEYHLKQLIFFL